MNIKKLFQKRLFLSATTILFALMALSPTLVLAAGEPQEVSYDDLVNELNRKKSTFRSNAEASPFDTIKIHAGLGLITSANDISAGSSSGTKYQNGFQLSLGIDLFSPEWAEILDKPIQEQKRDRSVNLISR